MPDHQLMSVTPRPAPALAFIVAGLIGLSMVTAASAKLIALKLGTWRIVAVLAFVLAASYALRLAVWLHLGRRYQLSFVYPLLSINYVLAAAVGYLLFDEHLPPNRVAGLALVVAGVVMLATSRHRLEKVPPTAGGTP